MARNVIAFIACFGALVALFFGYRQFAQVAAVGPDDQGAVMVQDEREGSSGALFTIDEADGGVTVPGQEGTLSFTVYEPMTGRPLETISAEKFVPVAGSKNEARVEAIEIVQHRDTTDVTVRAAEGQFVADGIEERQPQPKRGWLAGAVTIEVLDFPADAAPGDPPARRIVIAAERVEFDLERSDIRVVGPFTVTGDNLRLASRDLHLIWNPTDNRPELLELPAGGEVLLTGVADASLGLEPKQRAAGAADEKPGYEQVTTYHCRLAGDVVARDETWAPQPDAAGALTGPLALRSARSIRADELLVLLDMPSLTGRGKQRAADEEAPDEEEPADAAPASAPAVADASPATDADAPRGEQRRILTWTQGMVIAPERSVTGMRRGALRRHVRAQGGAVVLEADGRRITCGELRFHEESRRLWLSAAEGERIAFDLSPTQHAQAEGVYADFGEGIVKLVGDITLRDGQGFDARRVSCDLWAELRLRGRQEATTGADAVEPTEPDAPDLAADIAIDDPLGFGELDELDSVTFVGNVRIRDDDAEIRAHRLFGKFMPPQDESDRQAPGEAAPAAVPADAAAAAEVAHADGADAPRSRLRDLEYVVASGQVRMRSGQRRLRATWLKAIYAHEEGQDWPAEIEALGAVRLSDRARSVLAVGQRLEAQVDRENEIRTARIDGAGRRTARVVAESYDVRGPHIEVTRLAADPDAAEAGRDWLLGVPGPAVLRFASDRSLRGELHGGQRLTRVTAGGRLEVDTRADVNRVVFTGGVQAVSGDEVLDADKLTLTMRDEVAAPREPGPYETMRRLAQGLGASIRAGAPRGFEAKDAAPVRKEPVRLVAERAQVTTTTPSEGGGPPLVAQRIEAPQLLVEIPERRIHTLGETLLHMDSRRLAGDAAPQTRADSPLGVPSSLLSSGPSVTVLRCTGSMNYLVGDEGPAQLDRVLFEGEVGFVHKAGRDIPDLEQFLPSLAGREELKARLPSRTAWLLSDQLEIVLDMSGDPAQASGGRRNARLAWLNATGRVELVDRQDTLEREVTAHQIEFDQAAQTVKVFGREATGEPARVIVTDQTDDRLDEPVQGFAITVFLADNTVRSGAVRGSFRP